MQIKEKSDESEIYQETTGSYKLINKLVRKRVKGVLRGHFNCHQMKENDILVKGDRIGGWAGYNNKTFR